MHNCVQKKLLSALAVLMLSMACSASFAKEDAKPDELAKPAAVQTPQEVGANNTSSSEDQAAVSDEDDGPASVAEPSESFNRAMFTFNDKLDQIILKPVATGYNKIMPKPLNQGIANFFNNIRTLPTIANDILQLHLYQALSDTWRLTINTTIGIGGLFDMATRMGLTTYSNDFGLTLARWGYKKSNYIVLPFFGPSSLRDGLGLPVDYYAFSLYPHIYPTRDRYALYGLGVVNNRAQLLQFEAVVDEAALDKYVFIRNAYMQRRAYEMEQNQNQGFFSKTKDGVEPMADLEPVADLPYEPEEQDNVSPNEAA